MKKLIFLLILTIINMICCIKLNDFCFPIEIKSEPINCQGKHGFNCRPDLCSKDRYSCQSLSLFYKGVTSVRNEKDYYSLLNHFNNFFNMISNCSVDWTKDDVCFNVNNSKCIGKYSYKCGYYCALNKKACIGLKNNKQTGINRCM